MLVRRYLKDLSLPDELGDYIDRLINFHPPVMKFLIYHPNYEARAMAYIVFILKLLFGIDGYRELEISKSAQKLNKKLKMKGIKSEVFVYEEWREYIAYRNVILSKYYFPFLIASSDGQYQGNKPYKAFLAMLDRVKQDAFRQKSKSKTKVNIHELKKDEKIKNSINLANKLFMLHGGDDDEYNLNFDFTFTPLYDAMEAIIESKIDEKLNKKIIEVNHRERHCGFFLNPKEMCELFDFPISIKKCTFPKSYFIKTNFRGVLVNKYRLVHDDIDEKTWLEELKKSDKEARRKKKSQLYQWNSKRRKFILNKRYKVQSSINAKKRARSEDNSKEKGIFDFILGKMSGRDLKRVQAGKDEIEEGDLDEFTAMLTQQSCRTKFEFEKIKSKLVFVAPDFNVWHRYIYFNSATFSDKANLYSELPKAFRWLMAVAANLIHQKEEEIYAELMIIEKEFMDLHHPIELLEAQPGISSKMW